MRNQRNGRGREHFLDYSVGGQIPLTFSANTQALTFTLSGLSKVAALPQMKVAWIATTGSDAIKQEALSRLAVIADTYLSMSAPAQLAVPTMLAETPKVFKCSSCSEYAQTSPNSIPNSSRRAHCHRLTVEGGWYIVPVLRVPVLGSDEELAVALLRNTGVLLHPGHFYELSG